MSEDGKRQHFKKYEQLLQRGNETHKTNRIKGTSGATKQTKKCFKQNYLCKGVGGKA